jgi:hypothetical protein
MSSPVDEAWQLLHHLRDIPNPLAPKSGLVLYLWKSRKAYIRRSCAVARIQGGALFPDQTVSQKISVVIMWLLLLPLLYLPFSTTDADTVVLMPYLGTFYFGFWFGVVTALTFFFGISFYSAMLSPVRWAARQGRASSRILNDIGTYVARRRSWSLLQEIAFGLEGYRFELPLAEREPTFASQAMYKYEDLPTNVEQRALANRDEWIRRNFGDVTKTFSNFVVTASDLSSLLRMVETDLSLVHAAYYTDDECIWRIADWIAGKG